MFKFTVSRRWLLCSKLIIVAMTGTQLLAQNKDSIKSPVIAGDFPDPSVIRVGNSYYAAGTSSEWAPHYPIFQSNDLLHWRPVSFVFMKKPSWTSSSFWAPELFYHNNRVYVYYTARDTNNISCIGVATAEKPEGPFTDHGMLIKTGKEAIDAFVINDSGKLYISWKAYGLDKRPIELLASRLSADGLKLVGETFSIKKDSARVGLEGQSMIKKNGYYYLFYSAGSCCGVPCTYNVRVARSRSIRGPYKEFTGNPILQASGDWMCTGHGTPVQSNDNKWFYLYHAYEKKFNVFTGRQGLISEMNWNESTGWPKIDAPTASVIPSQKWVDDFDSSAVSLAWQSDFRSSELTASTRNGSLFLSGKPKKENQTGTVLCVRPFSGDYEISTSVNRKKNTRDGLVIYGDAASSAGISVTGDSVELWNVKDNKRQVLRAEKVNQTGSIALKIKVENGYMLRFFYQTEKDKWIPLTEKKDGSVDGNDLRQWDRSPRPGIVHYGASETPGEFLFFSYETFDE